MGRSSPWARWIPAAALILLAPIASGGEEDRAWNLKTYGSLRGMFHENATVPVVDLDEIVGEPDLYAVGALSHLAGEITILGGVAYVARVAGPDSGRTIVWSGGEETACLLVTARVGDWFEVSLEETVTTPRLDNTLAEMAESAGLNVDEAFPFVIEGEVRDLHWHVIGGERLEDGGTSHSNHLQAAVRNHREKTQATLIGFYSLRDHGIFTHMGSNTHIHCVLEDPLLSGHVDEVILPAGTRIRLPAAEDSR